MWHLRHIPKTFYGYWGNTHLPWLRYLTLQTFKHHNPDWHMVLYTKENQTQEEATDLENYWDKLPELEVNVQTLPDLEAIFNFDLSQTPDNHFRDVYLSDYLRWYLLYETGGLWSDMDILYLQPLEKMAWNHRDRAGFTAFGLPTPYNNFLLSAARSPFSSMIFEKAYQITIEEIHQDPFTTGPKLYQKVRGNKDKEEYFTLKGFCEIPQTTTEVVDSDGYLFEKPHEPERQLVIFGETVGVHWHGGGLFKKYKELSPSNYTADTTLLGKWVIHALNKMQEIRVVEGC